ncbi:MAG: hypothetical protein COA71_00625 [SAR86 cluster bacterium]|uniref:EAL domain-containing protein n=1 Tax=SAR86 cluster bacterium TaxID=2030880 RepID=A0A2A5CIY6_9GAMM|nr:MAG: hypothetical protein COA71_00625 [SAR86 cluster bacterium]
MDSPALIKILILSSQTHAINKLLSTLRNEGVDLKTRSARNKKELYEQIKFQSWDLILCCEDAPVSIDVIRETLITQGLELPIIFLTHENSQVDTAELFKSDIHTCLSIGQENQIITAIKREAVAQQLKHNYRRLQLDFKELGKRHQALMDASTSALAYIQEGMHLYCNKSYAQIFSGKDHKTLQQSPLLDLFEGKSREKLKKALSKKIESELKLTLQLIGKPENSAQAYPELDLSFTPVSYDGQACLQLIVKPASGNPTYSAAVNAANKQDLLTRLYNKSFFLEKIEFAVAKAIKQQQHSSLLIVHINEFLDIKSIIGLGKANQVLNDIAAFLNKSIQKKFAAARLDDYQFGLLIDDCKLAESIDLANFIKSKINNHITTTSLPNLQLSCSIGVAVINENALDAEDLLAKANANLHKKIPSLDDFQSDYSQKQDINVLTAYINLALKEQRFKLLFQPILELKGEKFQDYEVLSRMLDSEGNDMLPSEFLPLADLNGLGEEFDKIIVSLALSSLQKAETENIRLIINLTSNTLLSKTFLPWLSETLQSSNLTTDRLIFQISEIQICNNLEYCLNFSDGLKQLGLSSIVCHYGCAVNPENYLDKIKPIYVKLDKSLVSDIGYNQYQQNELKNLFVELHNKNVKVAVPQVEDASILPVLWRLGADFIQGFCLERPRQTMDYEFIQNHEITLDAQTHNH